MHLLYAIISANQSHTGIDRTGETYAKGFPGTTLEGMGHHHLVCHSYGKNSGATGINGFTIEAVYNLKEVFHAYT